MKQKNGALPVFYSFRRCPYAIRARLAVQVSGLAVELREIVLRDKPQAFLDTSPSATVPAMRLADGSVLDESLDIMLHVLATADPQGWLTPETGGLDDMLALIGAADAGFKRDLDRAKYPNRYPGADPDAAWRSGFAFLEGLSRQIVESGGHLFGARPALADMALLPFVRQFAFIDKPRFDAEAAKSAAPLARWLEAFLASAEFAAVMPKFAVWQPGEAGIAFPQAPVSPPQDTAT
ncbi:glutathione S-transferase N-terminal domain-containing protein [Oricola sp.]|uniref:glutathione S-transferase N-terminal domain-containing protein n=1 Tax=Oricola sp. TaxID=1979950 RepID=UPI003BAB8283